MTCSSSSSSSSGSVYVYAYIALAYTTYVCVRIYIKIHHEKSQDQSTMWNIQREARIGVTRKLIFYIIGFVFGWFWGAGENDGWMDGHDLYNPKRHHTYE